MGLPQWKVTQIRVTLTQLAKRETKLHLLDTPNVYLNVYQGKNHSHPLPSGECPCMKQGVVPVRPLDRQRLAAR